MNDKSIIYYTDSLIEDPIKSLVRTALTMTELPIISCSLNTPIKNFGENIVLEEERGYFTMLQQILMCLVNVKTKYVFFCEHDVLYPKSHFDFTPPKDNVFYYDENVWRWKYPEDLAISYDRLISLSGLCSNTKFVLDHYLKRLDLIDKNGWQNDKSREPQWARIMGYEPGTKKKKRGGYWDDEFETWRAKDPMVDIRHKGTFSPPKVTLDSFKHQPKNWQEIKASEIPEWNLKSMFKLWQN